MAGLFSRWSKKRVGKQNDKLGRQFLLDNGKNTGITTTVSGLQYQVIQQGEGQKAKSRQKVTVYYRGTFIDGREFDSSTPETGAATFMVSEVIPGWSEALKLMNPGSKYKLFIPAALAYGSKGAGDVIGPNEVLIFETELLRLG